MDKKEIHQVTVLDRQYPIACTKEQSLSLSRAAHMLDKKMRHIRDQKHVIGIERVAILAGLQLAHELILMSEGKELSLDASLFQEKLTQLQQKIDVALKEFLPHAGDREVAFAEENR